MQSPALLLRGGLVTWFEHIFADVIRQRLNVRNLGVRAAELLDGVILRAKGAGAEFLTVGEYGRTMSAICSFQ